MKIKSIAAGMIVAATMLAVGPSQAANTVCSTCPTCTTCGQWTVPGEFSGTGWGMVPCNTYLRPAATWDDYSSGRYAPPTVGRGVFFFGGL